MPPNTIELPIAEPGMVNIGTKPGIYQPPPTTQFKENYGLKIFQSSLNLLAHTLIGAVVGANLLYAFKDGTPLGPTPLHIVLCVIGYQLLMAQAILSLSNDNGWSFHFKLVDKRRAHWIVQVVGSGLAIGGSFHKILDKNAHWNSLHGQFGLVALVFTVVSFVNGLTSLWAYELRSLLPGNLSKITHIIFGIVAFVAASLSLIYGMDKNAFRNWTTNALANTFIAFTAIFTFIIIVNPLITFFNKSKSLIKK